MTPRDRQSTPGKRKVDAMIAIKSAGWRDRIDACGIDAIPIARLRPKR
jgi:hypothetical protein